MSKNRQLDILYVASEAAPFAKTGGLGDVAGSLPQALARAGQQVAVMLPLYGSIANDWRKQMQFCMFTHVELAWRREYCGVYRLEKDGVIWYFLDNERYFKRSALYGEMDDGERFGFFSAAVVQLLPQLGLHPDVIACNDWQTALIPMYLREAGGEFYDSIRCTFTIHNMEYQGRFPDYTLWDVFGLPRWLYDEGLMRFDGQLNLMKGALYRADYITTVSPSYAEELRTPEFACGLQDIVEANAHKLLGIVNGLDVAKFDPANADHPFSAEDLSGKALCKQELQQELGLTVSADTPMIACISRLVHHKGFDLVCDNIRRIMDTGAQLVVLGTGEKGFEDCFKWAAEEYPGRVSANIRYSEALANRIYAAADLFLMPSRSEPCGLAQMISMRFGTLPLVHAAGGLRDTVRGWGGEDTNGFSFGEFSADALIGTLEHALRVYRKDETSWQAIQQRGMREDFSWDRSAQEYIRIFRQLAD